MATFQATSVLTQISIPAQIHAGFFSREVIIAMVALVAIVLIYKALVWD